MENHSIGASAAVEMSVAETRIVHIWADSDGLRDRQLLEWSEGSATEEDAAGRPVRTYWGERADGQEWRVHVHGQA